MFSQWRPEYQNTDVKISVEIYIYFDTVVTLIMLSKTSDTKTQKPKQNETKQNKTNKISS